MGIKPHFTATATATGGWNGHAAKNAAVTCSVTIGTRDAGGFGLAVKLQVVDRELPQAKLEALAREAHERICPYSHATRGDVQVHLMVVGA